jgi:hypothetical protein
MKSFIWLWLCSLASATCDINYGFWTPDYGMTVLGDITPALPDVGIPEFEMKNPGVKAGKIKAGDQYKIPYSPAMVIIEPAVWSGNCPKTLLLRGVDKTQKVAMPSQASTALTTTLRTTPTSDNTYETRYTSEETDTAASTTQDNAESATGATTALASGEIESSNADLYSAADPTDTSQTGQATDTARDKDKKTTLTPVERGSSTATDMTGQEPTGKATDASANPTTPTPAETNTPTPKVSSCWTAEGGLLALDPMIKETRVTTAGKFCQKFKKNPLTSKNRQNSLNEQNLNLEAYISPNCNSKTPELDESRCLMYFAAIEKECSSIGGLLEKDCITVWIAKPQPRLNSRQLPAA